MTIIPKPMFFLREKQKCKSNYNIHDYYEKILINPESESWNISINCMRCSKNTLCNPNFKNIYFSNCIFKILKNEANFEVLNIYIDDELFFSEKEIKIIKNFMRLQYFVDSINRKILKEFKNTCKRYSSSCYLKNLLTPKNPIIFFSKNYFLTNFNEFIKTFEKIELFLRKNKICRKCLKIEIKILDKIEKYLNALVQNPESAKKLIKLNKNSKDVKIDLNPLNNLIICKEGRRNVQRYYDKSGLLPVKSYYVDNSKIIEVHIYEIKNEIEKYYEIKYHHPFSEDFMYFLENEIKKELLDKKVLLESENLNDLISRIVRISKSVLSRSIQDTAITKKINDLSTYLSFSILGLKKIFPLLIDDYIEEVFLDSPDSSIYISHVEFDKCKTNITLLNKEIKSFINKIRFETNKNLNEIYPTLKCVLKNQFFNLRINVDVKPLNYKNFSLDIRRLNKKFFNILELISLKTLSIDLAAFLIFCLHIRFNITIIGRTNSGKTTLLNALDIMYPRHFRKIYVEDVVETIDQDQDNSHQLKFQINHNSGKSELIKNLLHRTPDVLVLGEILTKKECEALFHCLSVGLKGLQTIHANDSESLLTRFMVHFGIDPSCISDIDFLVLMKKFENGQRRVIEITEFINENETFKTHKIALFDPNNETWILN
ncbi:MAG: ATPase, T2SS/T4P/T4SS family, partial [Promethearchaeota archaeon]